MAPLGYLLWALKTAKGVDHFAREKWLATRLEYLEEELLPDLTFVRWGDCVAGSRCGARDELRAVVDLYASGLGSKAGFALSSRIADRFPGTQGYHASVLPTFFLFGHARETAPELPLARLYGERSIGQALFRTGWGEGDTVVSFKAGDYFDDHGHFDQGSFTIWRRGHLAVDAGVYTSFDSDHRKKFARTTVAHNTLLVGPDDERGGQRIVSSQDSRDLADYLAKKESRKLESADVVAWKSSPEWTWLSADLTRAYEPGIAALVARELVWIKGALVVCDKVESSARARFLLHSAGDVEISGARFELRGKAATLHGTTLLPKSAKLSRVKSNSVDGRDLASPDKGEYGVPGEWRLEVEGPGPFLHVLVALDPGDAPPAVKLVESGDSIGVELLGKTVLFKRAGLGRSVVVR
jgi:hypothetical protein